MKLVRTLLIGALAVATVIASAQGFGGGQRGGMRGGWGGNTPYTLLGREDVKTELKITDDQSAKLTAIQEDIRNEMMAQFQNGGGRPDREAMQKIFAEVGKKVETKTKAILTPEQSKRLMELYVQRSKNRAIMNADVQKALGLKEEQIAKVKDLNDAQQKANQGLFQKMQSQEIDRDTLQAKMKSNDEAMNTELGKVLTDDQKKKLVEMGGKAFEFKEDEN